MNNIPHKIQIMLKKHMGGSDLFKKKSYHWWVELCYYKLQVTRHHQCISENQVADHIVMAWLPTKIQGNHFLWQTKQSICGIACLRLYAEFTFPATTDYLLFIPLSFFHCLILVDWGKLKTPCLGQQLGLIIRSS